MTGGDGIQLTVGTGAQVIRPLAAPVSRADAGVNLYRSATPDGWYHMGATVSAGLALNWVRETMNAAWAELYAAPCRAGRSRPWRWPARPPRANRVILLDEPTAALGVVQTKGVLDLIRRVRDRGLGVVFISHSMPHVMQVADEVQVMRLGRRVATYKAKETTMEESVGAMTGAVTQENQP